MTAVSLGAAGLVGRRSELGILFDHVDRLRAGGPARVLVVRGEPGIGKTSLLAAARHRAGESGLRVLSTAGTQSEADLPFSGLHQLLLPLLAGTASSPVRVGMSSATLERLERLPERQRDALSCAFGLGTNATPDRFLVALAVLTLLSEEAEDHPLFCTIDDAQWLDRSSAQTLAFVARRLSAESVILMFAASGPSQALEGLPELMVEGLRDADALTLLRSVVPGRLDERVRERIVAETRGNPLALLELPRGCSPAQLAGGFGLPTVMSDAGSLTSRIEESFLRRLESLPVDTQRLLLVAAAEPVGDPPLLWRAAEQLGIASQALAPAAAAELIEVGLLVQFRHPLVRSAVYRTASPAQRRNTHRALAEVTDPEADADRRAWHRAQATPGPDEDVASELERSADRARARGGMAAAAAFLERATVLTPDPRRRAERALAAAQAKYEAGAFDEAVTLLDRAQAGPLVALQDARVDLLRAQVACAVERRRDALPLMLRAAKRLEPLDVALARETYLDALSAAVLVGRLATACGVREVAEAARAAPPPSRPARAADLLLDGLAVLITDGSGAGAPMLKRALGAFRSDDISREEEIRWLRLASRAAIELWDDESWSVCSARLVELAHAAGALTELPAALTTRVYMQLYAGEVATAASMVEEVGAAMEVTGRRRVTYAALGLVAWRGREAEASELIERSMTDMLARGEGIASVHWAQSVVCNGLGRSEDALAAAELASEYPEEQLWSNWGLSELIDAAARSGVPDRAGDAMRRLSDATRASGTEWGLGVEARSRALLTEGKDAERLYREAIQRLGRTRMRVELARAHLVYGEWLRRERRRVDARAQLRRAHDAFASMGLEAFAERARRELTATGEKLRRRRDETRDELTPQEALVARLARDGLTNAEIAAQLFLSPRTVEYHLHKVFTKLGISSRMALHAALPVAGLPAEPA